MMLKNLLVSLFHRGGSQTSDAHVQPVWAELEKVIEAYNNRDFEKVIEITGSTLATGSPRHALADHFCARALIELGREAEAERHLLAALECDDRLAEAHADLAKVLRKAGQTKRAEEHARRTIDLVPTEARYRLGLADILEDANRDAEALEQIGLAQEYAPERLDILERLLVKLDQLGQFERALLISERAMAELGPCFETHFFLGYARFSTGSHEAAVDACRKAIAIKSNSPGVYVTLGSALLAMGKINEAMAAYKRSLKILPDYPDAKFHLGMLNLMRGRYREGWAGFEYRFRIPRAVKRPCSPRWNGTSLHGRTLHVMREQGLGDDIMYSSCYPQLISDAKHCLIECEPRLERLFARSFPGATFVPIVDNAAKDELLKRDDVDARIFSASVPGYLRNSVRDFPVHHGYLRADPQRVDYWREKLRELGPGLKVGLSWRGGTVYTHRSRRTLSLDMLLPLLGLTGVQWVNLQYGDRAGELKALREAQGIDIRDWTEAIDGDYDETASLVDALDLVISVCTSVIHLTGALGREAWVMVPFAPEWRYGLEGDRMPWYPEVKLYRQIDPREWGNVIQNITVDLKEMLEQKK